MSIACTEPIRLAKHTPDLGDELKSNEQRLDELVNVSEAASLLEKDFRAVTATKCLMASSHNGCVPSDAAFVCQTRANPSPAPSGNTVRNRLNWGGDRRFNSTLHGCNHQVEPRF